MAEVSTYMIYYIQRLRTSPNVCTINFGTSSSINKPLSIAL